MKTKFLFLLILIVTNTNAESVPNFNTTKGIVSFPMVTVDNKNTFTNVELLLDSNGQWRVLSAEQEQEQSLTGSWRGILADGGFYQAAIDTNNNTVTYIEAPFTFDPNPGVPLVSTLQIVQNNQLINGIYCLDDCSEQSVQGSVTGTIIGNKVMMKIEFTPQHILVIEGERIVISGKPYLVAFSEESDYIDPTKGPLGNLKWAYAFIGP